MKKSGFTYFLCFLCIILIGDLFLKSIPTGLLLALILLIQSFYLNKIENSFILIFFMGKIAGAFFISNGLVGFGGLFVLLGLILILNQILKHKNLILKQYIPLLLILLLFIVSSIGQYDGKATTVFLNGTIYFLTFSVLFVNQNKINFERIGIILLILSVYLLLFSIDLNNLSGPSHLLDFGFLRDQTNIYSANSNIYDGDFIVSYHMVGFISLIGLVFFLFKKKIQFSAKNSFFVFISFLVIYYSGGRQNLVGFFLVILLFLFSGKNISLKKIMATLVFLATFVSIILSSNSETLTSVLYSGGISEATEASGRSLHFVFGIEYFLNNLLTGVGIGFHDYGNDARWAHNLIIELLAEVGLIGTFIVLLITLLKIISLRKSIRVASRSWLIALPFLLRSMVSGSLTTNVVIFSFIFSMYFLNRSNYLNI